MKNKKVEKDKNEVTALYIPVCDVDRDCCMADPGCRAQMKYYPTTDQMIFDRCGC